MKKQINISILYFPIILKRIVVILLLFLLSPLNSKTIDIKPIHNRISLENENLELRKHLKLMEDKLTNLEKDINVIIEYDKHVYAKLLDISDDTISFSKYYNDTINLNKDRFDSIIINLNYKSKYVSQLIAFQLKKFIKESKLIQKNKKILTYYPTIAPIKTKDFICITTGFGWTIHPIYKMPIFHEGVDISAKINTQVFASANGIIDDVLYSKYGYGNHIVIRHLYGFETLYAHLNSIYIKKGQYVKRGQLIGTVGDTGMSTGPHLHYEIHKNDKSVDPLGYFYTYITEELINKKKNK